MLLLPSIVAAVGLLVGLVAAWSYSDRALPRAAGLGLAAWSVLVLAVGAFVVPTAVVGGAAAVLLTVDRWWRRRRERGDELAPVRRAAERLAPGGVARRWCVAAVRDGEVALASLGRLSFSSAEEKVLLGASLASLVELGAKLDAVDASLARASAVDLRPALRDQEVLEEVVGGRAGADGEWFDRVTAKRREVVDALAEGAAQLRAIRDKAVWMAARQDEHGVDDELELIDPERALADVREASALVGALAEGVGEVHLGPATRL
jgi:hypothetical protein